MEGDTGAVAGPGAAGGSAGVPAAPWRLRGTLHASLWQAALPGESMQRPAGARIASLAGRTLLLTLWAEYTDEGTLAYNELIVGTVVLAEGVFAPACTVRLAWVDNEIAAEGGRVLWRIPKQFAAFHRQPWAGGVQGEDEPFSAAMSHDGRELASLQFTPGWSLPGRLRFPVWTIQQADSGPVRTRCMVSGRLRQGRAKWRFAVDGPLAFLHGRSPMASARLEALSADFGV